MGDRLLGDVDFVFSHDLSHTFLISVATLLSTGQQDMDT